MGFIEVAVLLTVVGLLSHRLYGPRRIGFFFARLNHELNRLLTGDGRPGRWKLWVAAWVVFGLISIASWFAPGLVLCVLGFLPFWFHEVRVLLNAPDDAFQGRNDKLIWGLYLLFCPPVGFFLFREFRERNWAPVKPTVEDLA